MGRTLILCPTRGRPDNARKLKRSLIQKAWNCGSFDIIFLVDGDDPKLVQYLVPDDLFYYTDKGRRRLGPWLNEAIDMKFTEPYDIVGFLGDDVEARTYGWDKKVAEAMTPNGVVYCNDGWQGEGLPTGVFMDARMVEKAGYMVYPELVHLYIDNHWKAWGEALGTLTYLPNVLLEHMHPFAGKAESDAVYEEANTPDRYSTDGQAFEKFKTEELPELVKRLG